MNTIINKVCSQLPKGFQIKLCMENGSAWVECFDNKGNEIILPDSADKTLHTEIKNALNEANIYNSLKE